MFQMNIAYCGIVICIMLLLLDKAVCVSLYANVPSKGIY